MLEQLGEVLKNIGNRIQGKDEKKTEGFLNQFDFNQTCLLITLIFVVIFMYKKEIMNMLNLK